MRLVLVPHAHFVHAAAELIGGLARARLVCGAEEERNVVMHAGNALAVAGVHGDGAVEHEVGARLVEGEGHVHPLVVGHIPLVRRGRGHGGLRVFALEVEEEPSALRYAKRKLAGSRGDDAASGRWLALRLAGPGLVGARGLEGREEGAQVEPELHSVAALGLERARSGNCDMGGPHRPCTRPQLKSKAGSEAVVGPAGDGARRAGPAHAGPRGGRGGHEVEGDGVPAPVHCNAAEALVQRPVGDDGFVRASLVRKHMGVVVVIEEEAGKEQRAHLLRGPRLAPEAHLVHGALEGVRALRVVAKPQPSLPPPRSPQGRRHVGVEAIQGDVHTVEDD
mmetsp:Transcript_17218/g.53286  ORF Transcript_17218/g.53286 Transcript_17218/m.53286 type:complete len:336 (+) Transcript_17218:1964-2971(+)